MKEQTNKQTNKQPTKVMNGETLPIAQKGKEMRTEKIGLRVTVEFKRRYRNLTLEYSKLLHDSIDGNADYTSFYAFIEKITDIKNGK